jgi:hypothetical protein
MEIDEDDDDDDSIEGERQQQKTKKRKRNKNDEIDSRVWRTYTTVEDNETLQQISRDFGGSPSVQELINANIDAHPMITATSLLHQHTSIFIEVIDSDVESRIVDVDDVIFVKWPMWGDIWYECIVSEGADVPWVRVISLYVEAREHCSLSLSLSRSLTHTHTHRS